jgi:mitochondrial-processing peptidase subunit alpha
MLEQVEALGGNIQCASSRESMMYQAATFNSAIPTTVALLAETIRDARITEDEVAEQLNTASYEVQEIWSKPDLIIPELVHTAAYKDNTLGNPLLCPLEQLPKLNRDTIQAYRDIFYKPERIVIAFAGVEHGEAVRLADQYFGDMKSARAEPTLSRTGSETSLDSMNSMKSESSESSWSTGSSTSSLASSLVQQPPSKLLSKIPFIKNLSTSAPKNANVVSEFSLPASFKVGDYQPAKYTGGFLSMPPQPPSLNPDDSSFTHIYLAFEGLPISSDDIYALATLQTLLGGGGSFSAGGPGKGMYSRLYTNVLNQYGWVESCIAFNHSYSDSGLFGISSSCRPGWSSSMLDVMCRELRSLTLESGHASLKSVEVNRAKNQLRSSLLMNLESRMVELEDLGRQIQIYGRRVPVLDMCRAIESLTVEDLRRVARQVLGGEVQNPGKGSGAPTVVLKEVQDFKVSTHPLEWDAIQDKIHSWNLGRR